MRPVLLLICTLLTQARGAKVALIITDVQRCFTSGGTLEVTNGSQVVNVINDIRFLYGSYFDLVVKTQDWHCADHVSFASQHQGHNVYDAIPLTYDQQGNLCAGDNIGGTYTTDCSQKPMASLTELTQVLWPDHCVINTTDAELHPQLAQEVRDVLVRKGYHCQVDSYSAFYDNGGFTSTALQSTLQDQAIHTLFITGLATDYCVYWTALDGLKLGYKTYVIEDASRGVAPQTTADAILDMRNKGIKVIRSKELPSILDKISSSSDRPARYFIIYILALFFLFNCTL